MSIKLTYNKQNHDLTVSVVNSRLRELRETAVFDETHEAYQAIRNLQVAVRAIGGFPESTHALLADAVIESDILLSMSRESGVLH